MILSTPTRPVILTGEQPTEMGSDRGNNDGNGVRGGQFSYGPLDRRRMWKHLEYAAEIPVLESNNRVMVDMTPFYPYPSYWMSTLPEYQTYPNRQIGFDGYGNPISASPWPAYKEHFTADYSQSWTSFMYLVAIVIVAMIIIRMNQRK